MIGREVGHGSSLFWGAMRPTSTYREERVKGLAAGGSEIAPTREDQVRTARVARETFLLAENHLYNPERAGGFDYSLLGVFDAIEAGEVGLIETRLLEAQGQFQSGGFAAKLNNRRKVAGVYEGVRRACFTPQDLRRPGMRTLAADWKGLLDIPSLTPTPIPWVGAIEIEAPTVVD